MTKALTREYLHILAVCLDGWNKSTMPLNQREICFSWLAGEYLKRFGVPLHQAKLRKLCNLGFLFQGDLARAGSRRYYTLPNPRRVDEAIHDLLTPA